MERAPGWRMGLEFHGCLCVLCVCVCVCERERERERDTEIEIENGDLLEAGVPCSTCVSGVFWLSLCFVFTVF